MAGTGRYFPPGTREKRASGVRSAAQTALPEAKAAQIRGETVPLAEVEVFRRTKRKSFRNRILAVPAISPRERGADRLDRVRGLRGKGLRPFWVSNDERAEPSSD